MRPRCCYSVLRYSRHIHLYHDTVCMIHYIMVGFVYSILYLVYVLLYVGNAHCVLFNLYVPHCSSCAAHVCTFFTANLVIDYYVLLVFAICCSLLGICCLCLYIAHCVPLYIARCSLHIAQDSALLIAHHTYVVHACVLHTIHHVLLVLVACCSLMFVHWSCTAQVAYVCTSCTAHHVLLGPYVYCQILRDSMDNNHVNNH